MRIRDGMRTVAAVDPATAENLGLDLGLLVRVIEFRTHNPLGVSSVTVGSCPRMRVRVPRAQRTLS